jgi:carboxyl-terminal processing protease
MMNLCTRAAKFSALMAITAIATWFVGGTWNWATEENAQKDSAIAKAAKQENDYELLKLFVDTLDQVERNYVQDVSRRELVEAAIQGMLSKLDQHTNYISPQELDQFRTSVESEFGGIGIHVEMRSGELTVLGPVPGSPAHRAGLVTGDVITQVEGKPLKGLRIDEATRLLKGKTGTSVEIAVRRKDGKTESMKLNREVVRMETVLGHRRHPDGSWNFWQDPEKKLGYVRIVSFSRHTAEDVRKALESLSGDGLRGLVLDLRMNPGGLLSSAIEVSDLFVADGRIVSTSGRNIEEKRWDAQRRGTFEGFPIAVLVNRASASASEIVAACLQDHGRAIVIGERTWGKGSVQNVVELEGGTSALKLTTAKYFRPNGKDINRDDNEGDDGEWGVRPDTGFEIKSGNADLHELIAQFRIRERLGGENAPSADTAWVDQQLVRAVEYLASDAARLKPSETTTVQKSGSASKAGESKDAQDKAAKNKSAKN